MYHVIIYGRPDEFAMKLLDKVFNRRGLIKFLSRHVNKFLADYKDVAVTHGYGPACPVNFWFVGKKRMSDRIPTCGISFK